MSYREGMIKPNPEIYKLICDRYQINPGEAVFLDDNKANIDAARNYGLHAIHFQNYEQGKEESESLLKE